MVLRGAVGGQIVPFDPKIGWAHGGQPRFDGRKRATVRRGGGCCMSGRSRSPASHRRWCWSSTAVRGLEYSVSLGRQSGERLDDNNAGRFGVNLRDEKIRVLYMEGTPGATDTLENALSRIRRWVTSLFPQHTSIVFVKKPVPQIARAVGCQRRPYRGFPTNMVSLLKYDVVINSDIYREAFTRNNSTTPCRWWSSTEADS